VRPVKARNRRDKTKSKAIPGGFTTPFKSIKALEHVCVFDGRNSWPIIGNGNCGSAVTALCDLNNYLSGCATMFDCIVYQIGNGIENEISITRHQHLLITDEAEVYTLLFGGGIV
jgi:hypothetical protein